MKIKYSTKSLCVVKLQSIIGNSKYRFGINGNDKEIWFVLNKLNSDGSIQEFCSDNRTLQDQIYFHIFGRFPKPLSDEPLRTWSNTLEKDVEEKSKKLFPNDPLGGLWWFKEINKDNIQETLDYLKKMYED